MPARREGVHSGDFMARPVADSMAEEGSMAVVDFTAAAVAMRAEGIGEFV